ncbi:hypothetical protein VTI74DRAFT_7236 [Chaetomium olivicolor]
MVLKTTTSKIEPLKMSGDPDISSYGASHQPEQHGQNLNEVRVDGIVDVAEDDNTEPAAADNTDAQIEPVVQDEANVDQTSWGGNTGRHVAASNATNEEEGSDDDLFVSQPGQVKVVNGVIDLTEETEAESNARAVRVGFLPGGSEVKIKQEENDRVVHIISDTENDPEPEAVGDSEEVDYMLEKLRLEQRFLQSRQAKGTLKSGDAQRLIELDRSTVKLEETVQKRTREDIELAGTSEEVSHRGQPLQIEDADDAKDFQTTGSSSIRSGRKRKPTAQLRPGAVRKKPRRVGGAATKRKRGKAAKQSTKIILDLLYNSNHMAAGEEVANLPLLSGFSAKTVRDQEKQFRELCSMDPNTSEKKKQGDWAMIRRAKKAVGRKRYDPVGEKYLIKGMKTLLPAFQFAGTGWMVGREKSDEAPNGGILADSMGLGKTVETLACIAANPPSEEEKSNGLRITLIIVPANALGQWIDEAWKHCDGILISQYKQSDLINQEARNHSAIWITSYQEVLSQYPSDATIKKREGNQDLTADNCESIRPKYLGPLFRITFYRIVLDEAHCIKNQASQRTRACIELQAKYRWALSGTPIHNRLSEIFPYMSFLRAPKSTNWGEFRATYLPRGKAVVGEGDALASLLEKVMLKRTNITKFFGHALFELPRPHVLPPIWVRLSKEETLIYRQAQGLTQHRRVEGIFRRKFVCDLKSGHVKKQRQYRSWLICVLRLRQAVSHPFLLESLMKENFSNKDIRWLIDELSNVQTRTPFINQIGRWCEEQLQMQKVPQETEVPECQGLGAQFDMIRQLERVQKLNEEKVRDLCRRCGFIPDDAFRPECGHVFCRDCIESYIAEESTTGRTNHGCRPCNKLMAKIRESLPSLPSPEKEEARKCDLWCGSSITKRPGRGDDVNNIQPKANKKSTFLADSDRDRSSALTPSAKTIALKSILLDWHKPYPEDKIIVFTPFVEIGRIIGRMLQDEDIDFLYYFGTMSRTEKYKAVQDFADKNIRVASIQCTAQALNLACANRVLILDLWWNYAMEQQAFGRVYRMGQTEETYFGRIMVKNTIDTRLAQLQLAKLEMIAKSIKDHDSSKMTLTAEEIASLLGRGVRDENGNIISVEEDYEDETDVDVDGDGEAWGESTGGSGYDSDTSVYEESMRGGRESVVEND